MSIPNQPKLGAKIRRRIFSRAALKESAEWIRVAHKVATSNGATFEASAEFRERGEITITSLKRTLIPRGRDTEYPPSSRLILLNAQGK